MITKVKSLIDGGYISKTVAICIVADMAATSSSMRVSVTFYDDGDISSDTVPPTLFSSVRGGYNVFYLRTSTNKHRFCSVTITNMLRVRAITDVQILTDGELIA